MPPHAPPVEGAGGGNSNSLVDNTGANVSQPVAMEEVAIPIADIGFKKAAHSSETSSPSITVGESWQTSTMLHCRRIFLLIRNFLKPRKYFYRYLPYTL